MTRRRTLAWFLLLLSTAAAFAQSKPTSKTTNDPDKKEWTLLWPHDSLTRENADKPWRVSLPRDITWSLDRPAPARMHGISYDPHTKQVIFFGGHPSTE